MRGNARTSGERRRKEKDNVFGQGTRTPVVISILVKNPDTKNIGQIKFHDIGDYLTREQKLEIITSYRSLNGVTDAKGWENIIPDEFNDWIDQRDPHYDSYINLGDKNNDGVEPEAIFSNYSRGVATSRDVWAYNFSESQLIFNIKRSINFYKKELKRYIDDTSNKTAKDFVSFSPTEISWNRSLLNDLTKERELSYDESAVYVGLYRPFIKTPVYFNRRLNDMVYRMKEIFPEKNIDNLVIYMSGRGNSGKGFSTLMTNSLPDLNMQHSGGQGFPLYLYEAFERNSEDDPIGNFELSLTTNNQHCNDEHIIVDEKGNSLYRRKDAITDEGLAHFVGYYTDQMSDTDSISKEDLFYYIYGLLHCENYRERYAENLTKQLPNIPRVQKFDDFMAFSKAGRKLADLHIDYEKVDMYQGVKLISKPTNLKLADGQNWAKSNMEDSSFYVTKMKYAKRKNDETGKNEDDPTKIIYNNHITVENIPEEAYDYVVNGKPAIEWIVERQSVKTDKNSEITNDANDWAIETMGNARYPLELLLRVINVSLKTQKIVNGLPDLVLE